MKSFASLVILTAAAALSANATTVSCTVTNDAAHNLSSVATGSGPNTGFSIAGGSTGGTASTTAISCPGLDAGAGNIITNFQLLEIFFERMNSGFNAFCIGLELTGDGRDGCW